MVVVVCGDGDAGNSDGGQSYDDAIVDGSDDGDGRTAVIDSGDGSNGSYDGGYNGTHRRLLYTCYRQHCDNYFARTCSFRPKNTV